MLKPGERVRVTGIAGTVAAHVEACHTLDELPEIPDCTSLAHLARSVLAEIGVDQVAMLSHPHQDDRGRVKTLVFAALHLHGQWRDLQGQVLEIDRLT